MGRESTCDIRKAESGEERAIVTSSNEKTSAAERAYQRAIANTAHMCLADKVAAIKTARLAKEAAYAAIIADNA